MKDLLMLLQNITMAGRKMRRKTGMDRKENSDSFGFGSEYFVKIK